MAMTACGRCGGSGIEPATAVWPRLREERIAAGLTIREMAARIGVSPCWLSMLERGKGGANQRRAEQYLLALPIDHATEKTIEAFRDLAKEPDHVGVRAAARALPGRASETVHPEAEL